MSPTKRLYTPRFHATVISSHRYVYTPHLSLLTLFFFLFLSRWKIRRYLSLTIVVFLTMISTTTPDYKMLLKFAKCNIIIDRLLIVKFLQVKRIFVIGILTSKIIKLIKV